MNPLAMIDMKNKLKGYIVPNSTKKAFYSSNLDTLEDRLIKDLIQGEKRVMEDKPKNAIISLDEAVNRIKNSR